MELTMNLRHLAPTCPDTLRSYPFIEQEPFILTRFPHVYFCGNQDAYGERFLVKNLKSEGGGGNNQCLKIIAVPRFRETGSIVILDMQTLESFEIKLIGDENYKAKRDGGGK